MESGLLDRLTMPSHVACKKAQDDLIVLNLKDGTYYRLNPTAADLWERLRVSGDLEAAIEAMASEYDTPREALEQDLRAMVAEWRQEGLVCPPTTGSGDTCKEQEQRKEAV